MDINLTENNKETLIRLVRLTMADHLAFDLDYSMEDLNLDGEIFKNRFGAFVTLYKKGNLRGCIGYIKGIKPLKETIREMAISAAFGDPRFNPVTTDELEDLTIEISILSPIVPVKDVDDIKVGRDGLIISSGLNSGLLLPQVAIEYKWNVQEFLHHTCLKAGLPGDSWKRETTRVEKFSAYVFGEKNRD